LYRLLGPNGAGKTTTINILTGFLLYPTAKDIRILNQSILYDSSPIHRYVGVCPQFDILWDEFTVQEHLTFQCRQKGIGFADIYGEVQRVARLISLDGDAFCSAAKTLSGGMKRRLSIGMSIVGNPQILVLDEPTAGLDPENKQQVWQVIQKLRSPQRVILLTTHSMDEAEVLCNRIGIIAKGQLKCIGSPMHLKTKYSFGYTLTLNMRYTTDMNTEKKATINEKVDTFILTALTQNTAHLVNVVNHTRRYTVPKAAISLSELYETMEQSKGEYCIQEWGIALTSLEEVFISAVE
jgi:ABC-type multidrug transport system ATPase subunit